MRSDQTDLSDVGITLGPCTNKPKLTNDVLDSPLFTATGHILTVWLLKLSVTFLN